MTEQGSVVGVRDGRLRVTVPQVRDSPTSQETYSEFRAIDVSQVNIYGKISVSAQAMRHLFDHQIPVLWFSYGGWFRGIANGLPSKNVGIRRAQARVSPSKSLAIARAMISAKINNSRTMVRRNARGEAKDALDALSHLARDAAAADSIGRLLGYEGAAARAYFSALPKMLSPAIASEFLFSGRNRRPPTDRVNALLSFCYALLTKDLTATAIGVGLDPYLGVLHAPRFGRPALALDLGEEFRPIIADSVAITVLNNGELGPGDFVTRGRAVNLSATGRKRVIGACERRLSTEIRHPSFGYSATYRRTLEIQARMLAAVLIDEFDSYVGFRTR